MKLDLILLRGNFFSKAKFHNKNRGVAWDSEDVRTRINFS